MDNLEFASPEDRGDNLPEVAPATPKAADPAPEAKKPEDYTSKYKDRIDGVMGQLDGMKDFSYDPTRDAAYEQYKNSYTRQAKLANENAQANASAIYEAAEGHVLVGVLKPSRDQAGRRYPMVAAAILPDMHAELARGLPPADALASATAKHPELLSTFQCYGAGW